MPTQRASIASWPRRRLLLPPGQYCIVDSIVEVASFSATSHHFVLFTAFPDFLGGFPGPTSGVREATIFFPRETYDFLYMIFIDFLGFAGIFLGFTRNY